MNVGIILVHGYTGSPKNFIPLQKTLINVYGNDAVARICLPGHDQEDVVPPFDEEAFLAVINSAFEFFLKQDRKIVLVGHSTGGVLALSYLIKKAHTPHYLILAAPPRKIDRNYFIRWNNHANGKAIDFYSTARMVTMVNKLGKKQIANTYPVLLLHGEKDELVPLSESEDWKNKNFSGPVRLVIVQKADHHLFTSHGSRFAINEVTRVLKDMVNAEGDKYQAFKEKIISVEPEVASFLARSPCSLYHLANSPSGVMLADGTPHLAPVCPTEPVIANIEITTRCNFSCPQCARSFIKQEDNDMGIDRFQRILDLLPNTYRINIVGLGEPLLHPQIVDFVIMARESQRRVSLVTNAMCLEPDLSLKLIQAGLSSIVFSIDAPREELAGEIRPGTDLEQVQRNIKTFVQLAKAQGKPSGAVFSAVSIKTVSYFAELADFIADLGADVWMVADLNFAENMKDSLWKNASQQVNDLVREGIKRAFRKNLPVLMLRGLEEFGLDKRYQDFLLLSPKQLAGRSRERTYCYSPWQTIVVDVNGEVAICDCQPGEKVGNLLQIPLEEIWNNNRMMEYRSHMLRAYPPPNCQICPRF